MWAKWEKVGNWLPNLLMALFISTLLDVYLSISGYKNIDNSEIFGVRSNTDLGGRCYPVGLSPGKGKTG